MKDRLCANESKQKRYLKDGERISSPTVSLEDLFTTMGIDAYEVGDVKNFYAIEAYLHVKLPNDKHVLLILRDKFV